MYILLLIVVIIVCILLGFIVLVQNPKGGGLSSNFSSSSQLMGVQKTGDFLEKGTWILAITLMVLSLAINVGVKRGVAADDSNKQLHEAIQKASKPASTSPTPMTLPAAPAQQPQPQTTPPVSK
jgi:preprotein translocase subunit SecG